jgi:glycosyl hydrolase family 26
MFTSHRAVARPSPDSRRPAARARSLGLRLGTATLVGSLTAVMGLAAPAQAANHIVIGASGDWSGLQSHVGTQIAHHEYGKLSGPAKIADLVNIETTVDWSQVASGGQDANIKRWANALKGHNVMVSFSHEPMSKFNAHWGTASSFIAAWKHVVNVFNAQGSTSVSWVWNVTSYSFRVKASSWQYGAKWYPGDSYVDYVAGEAYNHVGCGQSNISFADKIKQIFAFANQHHKKFVAAEFASNAFPGRPAWIDAAHQFMAAHRDQFAGAFYYDPTSGPGTQRTTCHWHLSTNGDYSAYRSLVTSPGFGA